MSVHLPGLSSSLDLPDAVAAARIVRAGWPAELSMETTDRHTDHELRIDTVLTPQPGGGLTLERRDTEHGPDAWGRWTLRRTAEQRVHLDAAEADAWLSATETRALLEAAALGAAIPRPRDVTLAAALAGLEARERGETVVWSALQGTRPEDLIHAVLPSTGDTQRLSFTAPGPYLASMTRRPQGPGHLITLTTHSPTDDPRRYDVQRAHVAVGLPAGLDIIHEQHTETLCRDHVITLLLAPTGAAP